MSEEDEEEEGEKFIREEIINRIVKNEGGKSVGEEIERGDDGWVEEKRIEEKEM